MTDAADPCKRLDSDLEPAQAKLRTHPYLAAMEERRVARGKLRLFAAEQHHIINSDL